MSKSFTDDYLMVTFDSTRIYTNSPIGKGVSGGFAVGQYGTLKGESDFMHMTTENYFIGLESGINTTPM